MELFFDNLLQKFTKTKYYLVLASFLLVFFLILFSNIKVIPMRMGDFIFLVLVYLIFAIYRPGWSFLFFLGTIVLENVNLAPESLGIAVRPFQLAGGLTIVSLLLRIFAKRINFKLVKLKWYDFVVGVFVLSGFVSAFAANQKGSAFKQSIILFSFAILYWLVRNYIQTFDDLKRIAPFFIGSSIIAVFYGIFQNIRFMKGLDSFEVMPGRPNSTFAEPDWLGIYLTLLIAVMYSIIYYLNKSEDEKESLISNFQFPTLPTVRQASKIQNTKHLLFAAFYLLLVPTYILLILTVSRSAWLGAGFITLVFLKAIFTNFSFKTKDWRGKEFFRHLLFVFGSIILSLGIVYIFHLTNFQLFNRAESTGTGLQKITVACDSGRVTELPEKIGNVSELEQYDCRHINLEDIEKERDLGFEIQEVYRNDPNVEIRSQIYAKSIQEIKNHPIFGIGWGNISNILGKDERGAGLNSSNIFLEVWLGSGIIGLLAFLAIWVYIFIRSVIYVLRDDFESKAIGTFMLLGFFALLTPNLFNSGIYLGILWVFMGIANSFSSTGNNR